jgi:hypothetical protein
MAEIVLIFEKNESQKHKIFDRKMRKQVKRGSFVD